MKKRLIIDRKKNTICPSIFSDKDIFLMCLAHPLRVLYAFANSRCFTRLGKRTENSGPCSFMPIYTILRAI